jgi:hypothetical protein
MEGAVEYGAHEGAQIASRQSQRTYGVGRMEAFNPRSNRQSVVLRNRNEQAVKRLVAKSDLKGSSERSLQLLDDIIRASGVAGRARGGGGGGSGGGGGGGGGDGFEAAKDKLETFLTEVMAKSRAPMATRRQFRRLFQWAGGERDAVRFQGNTEWVQIRREVEQFAAAEVAVEEYVEEMFCPMVTRGERIAVREVRVCVCARARACVWGHRSSSPRRASTSLSRPAVCRGARDL